jgi:hypothetical protein
MELARFSSRGGFSVRGILTFALAVFVTVLLSVGIFSQTVNAADATWNGESIMYDGHQYYLAGEAKAGESHGLATGSTYYSYVETVSERPLQQKAHVIYFAPGADPPTTTTSTYVVYDYANRTYSNPSGTKTLSIDERGTADVYATSCAIEGVGWIVCSVSVFLAQGMDWVFSVLADFVAVQPPVVGDTRGDMYVAWNVMRSIANVAFVIAFLIIIYSQLTGLGVTNYGLKKLIPRLIIAALLVNLSYYICAIGIDISNVLGYTVQDIFIQLRGDLFNIDNDTWTADVVSWQSITEFVLSGGTAIAAGGIAATLAILGAGPVGLIFLILPALLVLMLAVLVVLVILAARQAIIILLLIIAPLAFVAYLLPNTESWFKKWRDLFMTMLIFFPAFSLVFGGSQLAGGLIIQNASSITVMVLGMIVQVAPLVITPLLLKLSGNLLGRIAGLVNDPRKGLIDRFRNWSNANYEYQRQRFANGQRLNGQPLNPKKPGELRKRNVWRRAARGINHFNRRLEANTQSAKALGDNVFHNSRGYQGIHERNALFDTQKEVIDAGQAAHIQDLKTTEGTALNTQAAILETKKARVERGDAKLSKMHAEIRMGRYSTNDALINAAQADMKSVLIETAALKGLATSGQLEQQKLIGKELSKARSQYLRAADAKAVGGKAAITRVRAGALASLDKLEKENRENTTVLLEYQAEAAGTTTKDFTGNIVKVLMRGSEADKARMKRKFSKEEIEAAWEFQAKDGQVALFDEGRASEDIDQHLLDRVISRHTDTMKNKGGYHLQSDPNLSLKRYLDAFRKGSTEYGTDEAAVRERFKRDQYRALLNTMGDTPGAQMGSVKMGQFEQWSNNFEEMLAHMDINNPDDERVLGKIHDALRVALEDDSIYGTMTDRIGEALNIENQLSAKFGTNKIEPRRRQGASTQPDPTVASDDGSPADAGDNPDSTT